jgi:multidrug efflux pump subunit AcrB
MATAVTTPLERRFTAIAGLNSMVSSSGQGAASIALQFDLSREIDRATVAAETANRRAHKGAAGAPGPRAGHAGARGRLTYDTE